MRSKKSSPFTHPTKRGGVSTATSGGSGAGSNSATGAASTAGAAGSAPIINTSITGSHYDIPEIDYYDDQSIETGRINVATLTGMSLRDAEESMESVRNFTKAVGDYDTIRRAEMAGKSHPDIKPINRYIQLAPKFQGRIERGLSFETHAELTDFLNSNQNGFSLNAMSSHTDRREISLGFAKMRKYGVVIKVVSNKSGASIRSISDLPNENEILVPKGTKYKVVGPVTQLTKNIVEMNVEEV